MIRVKVPTNTSSSSRCASYQTKPSPNIKQVVVSTMLGAIMAYSLPSHAQPSPPPPPTSFTEQIVYIETTEIPDIYDNLPSDKHVAQGIVNILDQIESEITKLQQTSIANLQDFSAELNALQETLSSLNELVKN